MSTPTGIEALVCADIAARQKLGIAKYGRTVAESSDDMLQHGLEEAMDLAVYLKAEIERKKASQTYSASGLLPCPFCGGEAEMLGEDVFETMIHCHKRRAGGYFFRCWDCECTLGLTGSQDDLDLEFGKFDTAAEAMAAWNNRLSRPAVPT